MKKFFQTFSMRLEDSSIGKLGLNVKSFSDKHPEIFCLSLLALACLIFLFLGMNLYPLIDVDETKYAVIARDLAYSGNWNNLNLNNHPFLGASPLYFWIVAGSIRLFGEISTISVRLPIAILSSALVFFTYSVGKRAISRKFGMLSAFVLLSSTFFLILAHVAILDMVSTVFITSAIYSGLLTHFCQDKNKKYFWWYFYLFLGLGVLSNGILALVIPAAIMLIYNFATKTGKEIFKPANLIPGIIIFLAIAAPWHILMYQEYGMKFINEYFLSHHHSGLTLASFIYIFLFGFFPWSFIFLAVLNNGIENATTKYKSVTGENQKKFEAVFEAKTNEQKVTVFASIYFIIVLLTFSFFGSITSMVILFPATSLLTGYYWWVSEEKNNNNVEISLITQIFSAVVMASAFVASVAFFYLPYDIQLGLAKFKHLTIIGLYLLGIFMILRINTKKVLSVFSGYVFIMLFIMILSVCHIFNFIYSSGENELVFFSKIAQSANTSLISFDFPMKPSIMVNYTSPVSFLPNADFKMLNKLVKADDKPVFVIIKNENFDKSLEYQKGIKAILKQIQRGDKYSLFFKGTQKQYQYVNIMAASQT